MDWGYEHIFIKSTHCSLPVLNSAVTTESQTPALHSNQAAWRMVRVELEKSCSQHPNGPYTQQDYQSVSSSSEWSDDDEKYLSHHNLRICIRAFLDEKKLLVIEKLASRGFCLHTPTSRSFVPVHLAKFGAMAAVAPLAAGKAKAEMATTRGR